MSGKVGRHTRRDQATRHSLLAEGFYVEALPVILDFDNDVASLVKGAKEVLAHLRFSGGFPGRGLLIPLIRPIADHVGQRVLDRLKDLVVQLRLSTQHGQLDELATVIRQIPDEVRECPSGIPDELQPHLAAGRSDVG
ncbi:MAG: hypothetical protein ACE5GJ_10790 [Gemmatimonadota bacterium]